MRRGLGLVGRGLGLSLLTELSNLALVLVQPGPQLLNHIVEFSEERLLKRDLDFQVYNSFFQGKSTFIRKGNELAPPSVPRS